MRDRDTAGGRIKPHSTSVKKKKRKEHIHRNWDKDLWDQSQFVDGAAQSSIER